MPELVHVCARLLVRNPTGIARVRGDLAIERHSPFRDDIGTPGGDVVEEDRIQRVAFVTQDIFDDLDSRLAQKRVALARHKRVGIATAHEHARDARLDDSLGARRLLARMATRLQRHVHRRASRALAARRAIRQRVPLGVGLSVALMEALADNDPISCNYSSHQRVRVCPSRARARKLHSTPHARAIELRYVFNHIGHSYPSFAQRHDAPTRRLLPTGKRKARTSAGQRNCKYAPQCKGLETSLGAPRAPTSAHSARHCKSRARSIASHACSSIRTLTVGPGLSPGQPLSRVADSGICPLPPVRSSTSP